MPTERCPWVRVWVEPRETIRQIVLTNPLQKLRWLFVIYGLPIILNFAQTHSMGQNLPLWAIVLSAVLLCPFIGYLGISIISWLLKWTGAWIGGVAGFHEVRCAVAWSNVPNLAIIGSWAVLLLVFKDQLFFQGFAESVFGGYQAGVLFLVLLVETIASIWGFILLLKMLSEVQKFSVWRALTNVMIPFVGVTGILWLTFWALSN